MKQSKFRGAAQSGGFRPIQVSNAEISRMREEGNRVLQGMRDAREAEIKNRQDILSETQANQRAEAASRERNFQIQTQNQQRELTGLQQEAQARRQQFEADQKAQADIFKNVAQFSEAAGKAYTQYVEAKDDRDFNEALGQFYLNPSQNQFYSSLVGEAVQDEAEELRQQSLDAVEMAGGDKLGVAQQRNYNNRVQRELHKAIFAYAANTDFNRLRANYIQERENTKGLPLTSQEKAGYAAEFTQLFIQKGSEVSGVKLTPGSLRTTLEFLQTSNQTYLSGERDKELVQQRQFSIDQETKIIDQNPAEFATNIIPSFRAIVRANDGDYVKAHEWLQDRATLQRADGTFNLSLDQIANIVLPGDKKPYALARPGRFADIKRARLNADTKFRQDQISRDNLALEEAVNNFKKTFAENPTNAVAQEAREQILERFGVTVPEVEKALKSYTVEAQTKAEQIERIKSLPDGFIEQKDVDYLSSLDPQAGRDLDKRFQAQQARYTTGVFKDNSDSFKTIANGVTSFGSQKPNTPASLFLQRQMRAEYRRRVDQRMIAAGDNSDATFINIAEAVSLELQKEVEAGARIEGNKWYRKPSKAGGSADFPNLNTGNVPSAVAAEEVLQGIKEKIKNQGIEATFDEAGSIITAEEAAEILRTFGKPGFVIPSDVLAASNLGNGSDPFTIINRQLRALELPELTPPQVTQDINNELSPELRARIYNDINGPREKMRATEQGSFRQTNRFQRPAVMRNTFKRSTTGAMTYQDNPDQYVATGKALQTLGFKVAEHPAFGGTAPVHAGNSYHGYGEAFDVTHQTGEYNASIEKTRQLKGAIRAMGLFEEIIGPGDGDPNHETHLHLGGLMRPVTPEDIEKLNSLFK